MSHFILPENFRKTGILTKGDPSKINLSNYQDPTYLSFTFLFDMRFNSPIFNGEAENFIQKNLVSANPAKYQHKLNALKAFKEALFKINSEMPWHWQSLSGVERLLQFNPSEPYAGGTDAKLVVGCLETINLNIAGLMQLYKKAIFDEASWQYILPPNLRKFTMYLYISDIRSMYDNSPNGVLTGESNKPFFMFELNYCEFDITSGSKMLGDLSASAPEVASNEIVINYEYLNRVDARALNGLVVTSVGNEIGVNLVTEKPDTISPVTDLETEKSKLDPRTMDPDAIEAAKDELDEIAKLEAGSSPFDPTQAQKLSLRQGINGKMKDLKNKGSKRLKDYGSRGVADLKRIADSRKEELRIEAERAINRRIPTLENVYGRLVRQIDNVTSIANIRGISGGIESVVGKNVHSLDGTSLIDILEQANRNSLINLGNVYRR